jgi:hypothetical protein
MKPAHPPNVIAVPTIGDRKAREGMETGTKEKAVKKELTYAL